MVGTVTAPAASVAQPYAGWIFKPVGTSGTELYSISSTGLLRNRFQPLVSVSLAARSPSVVVDQFLLAASATALVASRSSPPAGQLLPQPFAAVTAASFRDQVG